MKLLLKKSLVALAVIITVLSANINFLSPSTHAAEGNCRSLLGMTSWDCGTSETIENEDALTSNIAIIASNIFLDISVIAAYLVIGYVIYGGYQYMFSSGDTNKVAAGKKTLVHAFTGLGIVMLSNVILSAIRIALLGAGGSFAECTTSEACVSADELVTNLIQWVIGISGIVAAVFLVIGGISYMTSAGDANKLQKAKNTILYAIIGLVIVALAEIITAFVSNIIRSSESQSCIAPAIAKEIKLKELNEN